MPAEPPPDHVQPAITDVDCFFSLYPVAGAITESFDVDRPVSGLAIEESHVYWIEQAVDEVDRRAVCGATAELELDADDIYARLEVADSHLYWATDGGIARNNSVGASIGFVPLKVPSRVGRFRAGRVSGERRSRLPGGTDLPGEHIRARSVRA